MNGKEEKNKACPRDVCVNMQTLEKKIDDHHELAEKKRNEYRVKQDRLITAMCGDEAFGSKGFIQESTEYRVKLDGQLGDMTEKLDSDHKLLLPNRALFGFWKLIKNKVAWLIFLLILGGIFHVDLADIVKKILGVK